MITLKGSSGIYEGPTIEEMYTDGIEVNTKFHELNTDKYYYYDGSDWVEIPSSGGGGGFVPTEDQLAAMNSGITSTDVQQIETNKTNISTLNTAISPTAYILPTIDESVTSICTINSGGYATIGNLVVINIRFTLTSSVLSNVRLFNVAAPLADSSLSDGAAVVTVPLSNSTGDFNKLILISKVGNIFNPAGGSTIAAGTYIISAMYIKE